MAEYYDVTIAAVRPGTHPQALAVLEKTLAGDSDLLACWYSDIGALNRILIIHPTLETRNVLIAFEIPGNRSRAILTSSAGLT